MDEFAGLAIEAIVAARKRAEETKRQRQQDAPDAAPGTRVVYPSAAPGVRPPARPPGPPPRLASPPRQPSSRRPAAAAPPRGPGTVPQPPSAGPGTPPQAVAPERSSSPFGGSLVEPIDSPLLDLPTIGGPIADDGRSDRRKAARTSILAIFGSPASLIGGIVVSEVLAPPLSLRPPKSGP